MTTWEQPRAAEETASLGELTGVRSSKHSFYPEYIRSNERLTVAVQALDEISRALVRSAEGPRALVEAVLGAAVEHLEAEWVLLAVADGALRGIRPGFLLAIGGEFIDREEQLPVEVREQLDVIRRRPWELEPCATGPGWVRAPMMLEDEPVGGIVGQPGHGVHVARTDLSILRVLANQAAVALYNSHLFHTVAQLRGRTEQLDEEASRQAKDLVERKAELQQVQRRLTEAMQHQVIDEERHRIARELHDSVTQAVLSAGMTVEVCRSELESMDERAQEVGRRLVTAKDLTQQAVTQLRSAIYALHHASDEGPGSLPVLLERLSNVHLPTEVTAAVRVEGEPIPLSYVAEHSMLRLTGEALFNVATHADADQAMVELAYESHRVVLSIADDGNGDPAQLRKVLEEASASCLSGHHRGLANMAARAEQLGGALSIARAQMGGILIRLEVPLPLPEGEFDE
ncbi:signal transduction histidine kinase [Halopolyspora algeriensis]|uniref:Signal transduction histidine kinase n=1 Tax=Halopolyspora algeriensis TaxID=1500506 RepID=A0A368VHT4_9ACTN|nr:histidine kinase [Halopolyspora algeriensis]RCW40976.1 signal transduction histidine kinase [Halopolyspora algeriensis]TQM53940.1 signal transduction histidine kinase [Halopolyspora algeriensis]